MLKEKSFSIKESLTKNRNAKLSEIREVYGFIGEKILFKNERNTSRKHLSSMINFCDKKLSQSCVMKAKSSSSCINLLMIDSCFCFVMFWGFSWVSAT